MPQVPPQPTIFEGAQPDQIINVASVPQRSPFRYPGGKTWLVPRIRQWLGSLSMHPVEFIEPFAGGGIVSLTVAAESLADHVTMVEIDEQVAAVWQTIINRDDGGWLAERIVTFDLTRESLAALMSARARGVRERAFQTILKNRTYRGGILAHGSAPLKRGEKGKGIKSRWYAETLKRRILDIASLRPRLAFVEGDGLEAIRQHAARREVVFFIDPPYTAAGKRAGRRLYTHAELDHEELFRIMKNVAGDFVMTYDNADGVRELARRYELDVEAIAMKNTHHAEMTELLIGRNLDWARLRPTF
ncbi:MAG: DNA adenine methylase [Pyrinomonadaceae bacterium]